MIDDDGINDDDEGGGGDGEYDGSNVDADDELHFPRWLRPHPPLVCYPFDRTWIIAP